MTRLEQFTHELYRLLLFLYILHKLIINFIESFRLFFFYCSNRLSFQLNYFLGFGNNLRSALLSLFDEMRYIINWTSNYHFYEKKTMLNSYTKQYHFCVTPVFRISLRKCFLETRSAFLVKWTIACEVNDSSIHWNANHCDKLHNMTPYTYTVWAITLSASALVIYWV